MKKLTCTTGEEHQYDIFIERGIKDRLHEMDGLFGKYRNIVIITDKNVGKHYLGLVKKQMKSFGGNVYSIVMEPGEGNKNLAAVEGIYNELVAYSVTRSDLIVALGGGVVGDIAGFAAATYLRGIDYVQMPTSLLAQVDSSVGGKTGVDLPSGKNLVGAFKQPQCVIIDPLFLETLDDHFLMDGMAEVIKYGCISSGKLFVRLLGYQYQEDLLEDMEDIVAKCVQIKRNVVEHDEKETGLRRILNFGHTIGHVIETYFGYGSYSHGEAVAIGMYNITRMTVREGITDPEALENLAVIFDTYGLPYEMPEMDLDRVRQILDTDKKMDGDVLNLCVMPKIGKAEIVKIHKSKAIQLFTA
ncbi:MAG: 3-dehydroquinate synthase [Eubacterium aggregans]|uniref:3-dehydroquinate synthase n=1 Tax=Eubacterium aggregans TaxID=81409 RepID=UPI0023F21A65|nr:3-dehydroquinate synthase [Eubacterium aggregans]MDD4692055.1 3-dehydroquinate synthase [Eubacterium aggregans]MEA5072590.1 3-dehydroquinate synthase [Eubacterium aggregans]